MEAPTQTVADQFYFLVVRAVFIPHARPPWGVRERRSCSTHVSRGAGPLRPGPRLGGGGGGGGGGGCDADRPSQPSAVRCEEVVRVAEIVHEDLLHLRFHDPRRDHEHQGYNGCPAPHQRRRRRRRPALCLAGRQGKVLRRPGDRGEWLGVSIGGASAVAPAPRRTSERAARASAYVRVYSIK